ncbi:MAG: hypothetical protein LAP39_05675 [Acidobacteriia bacterium]|nr:hypothetical protein [Terriglobia bacterium]
MNRRILLALVSALPVCAQPAEQTPVIEIFGGPSYANVEYGAPKAPPATSPSDRRANFFGGQGCFSFTPHKNIRLLGDFGMQSWRPGIQWWSRDTKFRNWQFLLGPQFTKRTKKSTAFTHVLAGVGTTHLTVPSITPVAPGEDNVSVITNDSGFAMAFGGGLDVNVRPHFAIRVLQADYLLTHFHREPLLAGNYLINPLARSWQSHFRLGAGVVIKLYAR